MFLEHRQPPGAVLEPGFALVGAKGIAKAKARGVPIYLEVKGHGAWRIAPSGKVTRHIRFLRSPR